MADNRLSSWKEDDLLKDALRTYIKQGLQREETIDFCGKTSLNMPGVYEHQTDVYAIYYKDDTVSVQDVKEAAKKELEGLGKLLGYRSMHKKIRQKYDLLVTRDQVYNVMSDLDSNGLAARGGVGAKKARPKKGNFSSKGPNWVHSLNGHDKLMGFQNSTFPLVAWIQPAESCYGFEFGMRTVTHS